MIRTIALLAVAVSGLSLPAVAPAGAESPVPSPIANGRRCSFTSVTDPQVEGGEAQSGQINGGPMVAATPGASISMTCTIQAGADNSTHAGDDSCSASAGPTLQQVEVPPALCTYRPPANQPVYMCTEININGAVYYWDATLKDPPPDPTANPEPATGWTTSSSASCNEAIRQEIFPGPFAPVLDEIDRIIVEEVDPPLCAVLTGLAPGIGHIHITPEGDLYINGALFWDCPPYGNPDPNVPRTCFYSNHPGWLQANWCPGHGLPRMS